MNTTLLDIATAMEMILQKVKVYEKIGIIVETSCNVERLLNLLLKYIIPESEEFQNDGFNRLEAKKKNKTLGILIDALAKRIEIKDTLGDTLKRFLDNRNTLIHRFYEVPGHRVENQRDLEEVTEFLDQLKNDSFELMTLFAAFLHRWTEISGIGKGTLEEIVPENMEDWWRDFTDKSENISKLVFKNDES